MMTYEFLCQSHGLFEVKQPIIDKHTANCPVCGLPGQRIYGSLGHYYDNPKPLYYKNGSYEER